MGGRLREGILDVAPHLRDTHTRGFRAGVRPRIESGAGCEGKKGGKVRRWDGGK
jgi:hypothetical protein